MLGLPPAHRLARLNYPPRAISFAFSLLVLEALMIERGFSGWMLSFGVLQFLVYPQLAYVYACYATDSKRAELNNLLADSVMLGVWSAQIHFALWPACGACAAVCLNNAAIGGFRRLVWGGAAFLAAALAWSALFGFPFEPATGPWVSGLSFAGIVAYSSWIGIAMYRQNRRVVRGREALRSSEEQFRFIAEHAGDFVAALDAEGRFRYASASHLEHFSADAVAEGEDWLNIVLRDDRERAHNFLRYLMISRAGERTELRMRAARGQTRVLEIEGNPVSDPGGSTEMVILVCRDITARARAEIDFGLAAHAFDSLADAVLISDVAGRIAYVNRAYTRLTGFEPRDVVGRTLSDLRSGPESEQIFDDIWRTVARSGSWHGRFTESCKDGSRVAVWASMSSVKDGNGVATHYVWTISGDSKERAARLA